jgi:uncharacterized protein YrzB (UPF0473 family)
MNIEDNNEMEWDGEDEEFEVITVTSEDGSQSDYAVVDYATDGDVNYLLLLPMDEDEEDEDEEAQEAIIVKEIQTEGDEVVYESINDEAELERVMALFDDEERGYELH